MWVREIHLFHLKDILVGFFIRQLLDGNLTFSSFLFNWTDVAVTGIPEPQAQHAVIMCKFAQDCLERIPVVTRELAGRLGEDTKDLGMRVGVHSGKTTAGVLVSRQAQIQSCCALSGKNKL